MGETTMPEASDTHGPPPSPGGKGPVGRPTDAAGEHLAAALRTSFRLLGAIMVLGVVAFLGMGFRFVRPGEVAIRSVFGRVVGVTAEGLAYNWPSPIGRIEKIKVGERTLAVEDFWMNETKKDQLQPDLRKRQAPEGGLRPGWDGAALTGDRNLLHMRLKCTYVISRGGYALRFDDPLVADDPVVRFLRRSPSPGETVAAARERWRREEGGPSVKGAGALAKLPPQLVAAGPDEPLRLAARKMRFTCRQHPALLYRMNLRDPAETMHSVVCDAGTRAAAVRTADGLQRTDRAAFERDVRRLAQQRLDELKSGVQIRTVKVVDATWPLRTLPDYDAAQRAVNEADKLKSGARGQAARLLNEVAGPEAIRMLVGDPSYLGAALSQRPQAAPGEETNLVGRYNDAVRRADAPAEKALLERIDNVLVSDATTGTARRVLADARAYRTATIEAVKRRVNSFNKLLSAYRNNRQFALRRWWVETREEILNSPTAEKHYVTPGSGKTVIRINRDADVVRKIDEELLKKKKASAGGTGASGPSTK